MAKRRCICWTNPSTTICTQRNLLDQAESKAHFDAVDFGDDAFGKLPKSLRPKFPVRLGERGSDLRKVLASGRLEHRHTHQVSHLGRGADQADQAGVML